MRMTLNLRNLAKLIETLAKIHWGRVRDKLEDETSMTEKDADQAAVQKEIR